MTKKFFRSEIGERVEQGDLAHAAYESQLQVLRALGTEVLTGETGTVNVILDGFASADPYGVLPGTVVTIQGGKAVVGHRENGEARLGLVLAGGSTSHNRDMTGMANGTYGVFVRAIFVPDSFSNRLHWNATAVTPVEVARNIATRVSEEWEIAIELTSPGAEYIQVATAVKAGATVTLTDTRPWFYEGQTANSYAVVDAEWGSANDRNADRATYGVKTLRRFARAVQRQVQGIIGGSAQWWQNPQAGTVAGSGARSLTQLNDEKLNRSGLQSVLGDILPENDVAISLGSLPKRWATIFANNVNVYNALFGTTIQAGTSITTPFVSASSGVNGYQYYSTVNFTRWLNATDFFSDGTGSPTLVSLPPSGVANPSHWIKNAGAGIASFIAGVNLPTGVVLDQVDVYMWNNAADATNLEFWRQDVTTGTLANMRSGGVLNPGSVPAGPGLNGVSVAVVLNQNNTIDNSLYRYLIAVQGFAARQTALMGVRLHFSTTRVRM